MDLVVLSGKGGTGKTTIATALSELYNDVVRVDCDVDASNFYMFYKGKDIEKSNFIGGKKATIDKERCIECGKCKTVCKFDAIENFKIDPFCVRVWYVYINMSTKCYKVRRGENCRDFYYRIR